MLTLLVLYLVRECMSPVLLAMPKFNDSNEFPTPKLVCSRLLTSLKLRDTVFRFLGYCLRIISKAQ